MARGKVKWYTGEKGYGFIEGEEEDFFVHYTEIVGEVFRTLEEGSEVEVEIVEGRRGRKQASRRSRGLAGRLLVGEECSEV